MTRTWPSAIAAALLVHACDCAARHGRSFSLVERLRGAAETEGTAEAYGDSNDYDMIVIGGGSGGLACAKEAAGLGMRVAVCDYVTPSALGTTWGLGGTCVNVGCIPKKLMHRAALVGEDLADAKSYGWDLDAATVGHSWETLAMNVNMHVRSLNYGHKMALLDKRVDYVNALASFVDPHTVACKHADGHVRELRARYFVIAVGGRPRYLDAVPGGRDLVVTSDDLFTLPRAPGRTLCIGGGYVALECAGFLRGIGMDVDVLVRSEPLRGFDRQMAHLVTEGLREAGVSVLIGAVPQSICSISPDHDGGAKRRRVTWTHADGSEGSGVYDTVLLATGRKAVTADLNLNALGAVDVDEETGKIRVDARECTSVPHVFAIGDVLYGRPELTPVAIQAGRLLARRLSGVSEEEMDYDQVPTTVFTPVEYACVGATEERAIADYGEVRASRSPSRRPGASSAAVLLPQDGVEVYHAHFKPLEWTLPQRRDDLCYVKAICRREGDQRILGLHFIGPSAGDVMQGFALAIKAGATKADMEHTVGIHPTNAEEVMDLHITKKSGVSPKKTSC